MIAVVQRVSRASVGVGGSCVAEIGEGLHVLLGVLDGDSEEDMRKLLEKLVHLRIFADDAGKMNRPVTDVGGDMRLAGLMTLIVSAWMAFAGVVLFQLLSRLQDSIQ
jgi:D-tyrosyl-tRNA(Tyr) deacylase